jgi:AraC-like DNA-binding protein
MYLIIDIVTIFYLILCFVFLQKNKDYFESSLKSDGYRAINQWLIWLYANFTILFFMNITTGVRAFYLGRLPEPFYFHAVAFILLILNIKLYQFPTLLYGIKLGTNEHQKKITLIHQNKKKSQFDDNFTERYRLLLLELIQSKEIISQEYSIQLMASQLDVSTNSLNQYLKEELNINFSQLVNQSRIQVFINSTVPADFKKYSITGLVKLYGFKSLQQFKINFEKFASEEYETYMAKMKNNV